VHRSLVPLLALATLWLVPDLASAQAGGSRLHLGVGAVLDFGGEADVDNSFGRDPDLKATVGLRAHGDYAVHRHVSVGGLGRISFWKPDEDEWDLDRSFLLDIGPRVAGHYDWRNFRFYAALSPGLTISAINEDDTDFVDNPAAGFTMSLTVAGLEWWFGRNVGLFAELGWVGHWFEHDVDAARGDLDLTLNQCLFEFGFVFGA